MLLVAMRLDNYYQCDHLRNANDAELARVTRQLEDDVKSKK